jgi:hypothetical protein
VNLSSRLLGFVQVIPDTYTFVHPVFVAGNKAALQVVKDNKIVSLLPFAIDDSVVKVEEDVKVVIKQGSAPFIGFQPNEKTLWIGTSEALSKKISASWLKNALDDPSQADVVESVQEFLRTPHAYPGALETLFSERLYTFEQHADGLWKRMSKSSVVIVKSAKSPPKFSSVILKAMNRDRADDVMASAIAKVSRSLTFKIPPKVDRASVLAMFEKIGVVEKFAFSTSQSLSKFKSRNRIGRSKPRWTPGYCTIVMKSTGSMSAARALAEQFKEQHPVEQNYDSLKTFRRRRFGSSKGISIGGFTGSKKSRSFP